MVESGTRLAVSASIDRSFAHAIGDHLGCALEAFELERVTRQGNDPLEFSTSKGIRTSLTTMYKDCSDENQAAASNALDWLFRRLRECPRNEDMFTSVQV